MIAFIIVFLIITQTISAIIIFKQTQEIIDKDIFLIKIQNVAKTLNSKLEEELVDWNLLLDKINKQKEVNKRYYEKNSEKIKAQMRARTKRNREAKEDLKLKKNEWEK